MKTITLTLLFLCLSNTMLQAQWEKSSGITTDAIHALAIDRDSPGVLYAGTDRGVYLTKNNGESWTMLNTGSKSNDVWSLGVNGGQVLAGSFDTWSEPPRGEVSLSRDGGKNWTFAGNGLPSRGASAFAFCSSGLVATTSEGIFRMTNGEESWTSVFTSPKREMRLLTSADCGLFAGSHFDGVYRSQDDGLTWTKMDLGKDCSNIAGIACTGNTIYVAAWTLVEFKRPNGFSRKSLSVLFRSTDAGGHWEDLSIPEEPTIESVYASGDTVIASFISHDPSQGGIITYKINTNTTTVKVNDGDPSSVPTRTGSESEKEEGPAGIHISIDGGKTWTVVNEGLPITSIKALAVRDGYVFAGTYIGGLFRRPLSELVAAAKAGLK